MKVNGEPGGVRALDLMTACHARAERKCAPKRCALAGTLTKSAGRCLEGFRGLSNYLKDLDLLARAQALGERERRLEDMRACAGNGRVWGSCPPAITANVAEYCTGGDFGRLLEVKHKLQGVRRRRSRMANDAVLQGTVGTVRGNQEPAGTQEPAGA